MKIFKFFSKKIFPILLVNFIGILGYSIVIPILIFIVTDLGGNGFIYGILGAMYPFFQFIGAPILGRLSDRIGRKKVLVISQTGTFIAWCLFLIALILPETKLWSSNSEFTGNYIMTLPLILLFLARIFDGFTGGNVSVANAYLSDISTDEDRDKNFGMMGASTSLGFVLGPAVAGILASTILGEILPILLAAIISLIAILVIVVRLPESNPCMVDTGSLNLKSFRRFFQVEHKDCFSDETVVNDASKNINTFRGVLKQKGVSLLFSIYFLTFLAFSLFYAGLPIYASTMLEWTAVDLGIFLAYSSFIMILVQGPLLSFLSGKVSNIMLITLGVLLLSLSFFLLSFNDLIVLYIANTILSLGNGLMWPSFLSLLSRAGNRSIQGTIQGYGNSMGSLASIFGLVLGGIMFESMGVKIFIIGSGIFLVILILLFINYIRMKNTETKTDQTVEIV
ncbi:Predicted arabinose efflux permease, MFS family [Aquimarina amphilecti]|uniref:Predicted arabinose efflux permease, MFS family n=1 Tax=Aquimarina amphilecti TaxID=1038014 RepID=A0A1H7VYS3_AQUAM|nr:MFS transporter [Aquimarina amphilecti]SEM13935.1 Predicted arabinose efflux permease, MFS family [Aquimarina amphilecti]